MVEGCAISDIPSPLDNVTVLEALGASIGDSCTIDGNLSVSSSDGAPTGSCPIEVIRTYTVTDEEGNFSTIDRLIQIQDTTKPTASNPLPITVSGSVPAADISVVTDEADNCTANPVVSHFSDSSNGTCPVIITRTYRITDNCNNFKDVIQTITVNDAIPPVAICIANPLIITLDGQTGTASIIPNNLDDGSSDNCGNVTLSLSKMTFGCNEIGSNTVTLIVTDTQGNSDTCNATVIVNPLTIDSGTISGYISQTQTSADSSNVIEITACPTDGNGNTLQQDIALELAISAQLAAKIIRWESSVNGGLNWSTINNTGATYTFIDIQNTTLARAVFEVGDCIRYSPIANLVVIPPNIKPTITSVSPFVCFGENINVVAQSGYGVNPYLGEGGTFNSSNLNNLGWLVDGNAVWQAGNDNTVPASWAGTNGPSEFTGRCYDSDDKKFTIAHGVNYTTTLETPVFNTLGLSSATLEFDEAFNFTNGASGSILLSLNGGADGYPINLTETGFNYIGPSDSGFVIQNMKGNKCDNVLSSYVDNHISIDLINYIGQVGLRIKFVFNSNTTSSWAIDNIKIPQAPVDEVIQWTDENGVVISTGSTTSFTPKAPGVQTFGVTSLINNCRADGNEGTQFINVDASLAYAGNNINPFTNECGENTVTLKAYDNTEDVITNMANSIYPPPAGFNGINDWEIPSGPAIDHDNDSNTPDRVPSNYPSTGLSGEWSIVNSNVECATPASTPVFSNFSDPNSTFTAEAGTYTLRWTLDNNCFDEIQVVINNCIELDFDGADDYITFKDNYDRSGPFSIEMWVKPEDVIGTQSLISKRDANALSTGFDLRLSGTTVAFHWGNNSISIPNSIDAIKWHHIAVTFDGNKYILYINGIEGAVSGNTSAPTVNSMQCILGAMDQANNLPNKPVNYYHGWMDEVRIWNRALDILHIRQMMNQEIELTGGDDVGGVEISTKVFGPDNSPQNGTEDDLLYWSNLDGYYQMDTSCGYLTPIRGSINGRLRNIEDSNHQQSAPIPYTSANDGAWNNNNTWTQHIVWNPPNSLGFDGTRIDWNIVRISNNISSGLAGGTEGLTLLGLVQNSNNLTIAANGVLDENNNGRMLWVTHYLKLDGVIDLVGESQLLQKRYAINQFNESVFDENSSGYLERDQQGQKNSFNYNYWSSPVSPQNGTTNNTPYSVGGVLKDGTTSSNPKTINFGNGAYFADGALVSPIKISNRWIWSYNSITPASNSSWDNYYEWKNIGSTVPIKAGEGFIMKGTGGSALITSMQNYVFVGKPHSGNITSMSIDKEGSYLIGNPYPSALDANEFLLDNISVANGGRNSVGNIFNGTLYFWDHFRNTNNHILAQYSGGYAAYTLIGGVLAITNTPLGLNDNAIGSKMPSRYIPVGQAFFAYGAVNPELVSLVTVTGGNLVFNNSQRSFVREAAGTSVFLKQSKVKETVTIVNLKPEDLRPKIRLQFESPSGYYRDLLIGVDERTTNLFDIGFDAPLSGDSKEDMFWLFNESKFVIQGVPNFNKDQEFPLGILVDEEGLIKIQIEELENIEDDFDIYIFDKIENQTYLLNNIAFETNLDTGYYNDRFSIVFQSVAEKLEDQGVKLEDGLHVFMNNSSSELHINKYSDTKINDVMLTNYLGQTIKIWRNNLNIDRFITLPINNVATGVYFIELNTETGRILKKIIVE